MFKKNRQGNYDRHSTRVVNKHLPKYVSYHPNKKYRVCRKIEGQVVTFGYFKRMKDAKELAEVISGLDYR